MTATTGIEPSIDDNKFYLVTSDLNGYRINQLKRMEDNAKLVVEYLNSKNAGMTLKTCLSVSIDVSERKN